MDKHHHKRAGRISRDTLGALDQALRMHLELTVI